MKVIITAPCHQILQTELQNKGFEIIYLPQINRAELLEKIFDCEGLIITTRIQIDEALLVNAPQLKWIGRLGSGMEMVDMKAVQKRGIQCFSTPEGNAQAVGEHCLGLLLALMNNIVKSSLEIKKGLWIRDANRGEEIMNKSVGIIGYGNTGSAFARCIKGFSPKAILAYDKYKKNFGGNGIIESTLNDILKEADIVSFHLPLSSETKYYADKTFFNALQKPVYFINASRGGIVNTQDLLEALQTKKIKGAVLDVLENEQLNTYTDDEKKLLNDLLGLENVLITPHIAGYTHEAYYKMSFALIEKLKNNHLLES